MQGCERVVYTFSPKNPAAQYQQYKERRKKQSSRRQKKERTASSKRKELALLLKPAIPTPSAARSSISTLMCDQSTACNPNWHMRHRLRTIKRVHRIHLILYRAYITLLQIDDVQYYTQTHNQFTNGYH